MNELIFLVCGYMLFVCAIYLTGLLSGADLEIAWYDLWVGLFINRDKRRWYLFLIPCVGLKYPGVMKQIIRMGKEQGDE